MTRTATRPLLLVAAAAFVLPLLAGVAGAQEVYKWKDAKGVTHYSDAPPPGAKATKSTVKTTAATPAATAVAAPAESAECTTSRKNLALLQGKAPVGVDADKDGKPDTNMSDAERAAQAKLAQAGVDAYCKPAAAPKKV